MTRFAPRRPATPHPSARAALAGLALLAALGVASCLDRRVGTIGPRTSDAISERVANERIDKIDLLFMVDSSLSMADKQAILSLAVPDLLDRLITPPCVLADGGTVAPNAATRKCDEGVPEFDPVKDIHIGIISSSLGGHGGNLCTPEDGGFPARGGGLLTQRRAPGGEPLPDAVPTYKGLGFLAWDDNDGADGERDPAALRDNFAELVRGVGQEGCGFEASLEAWYRFLVDPSPPKLEPPPLDPDDPKGKARVSTPPVLREIDAALLEERANFLRPDSLVAIIALSDENDCSFIEGFYPPKVRGESGLVEDLWPEPYLKHLRVGAGPDGQQDFFFDTFQMNDQGFEVDGQFGFRFESGTAACSDKTKGPYSPECFNCSYLKEPAARAAAGCPSAAPPGAGLPAPAVDGDRLNLRCFNQRARFGFEALHPVQRYVDGLTQRKIYDTSGALIALNKASPGVDDTKYFADDDVGHRARENLVAPKVENPLFVDLPWRRYQASCRGEGDARRCDEALKPGDREGELRGRPDGRVYFAGIVGVPWQDIARNKDTLKASPMSPGGFRPPADIDWGLILGDPAALVEPRDPLMRESIGDRVERLSEGEKAHPVTGDDLGKAWNRINGHEWVPTFKDDLQYACVFPLGETGTADIQCADAESGAVGPRSCDCERTARAETLPMTRRNPLCESYDEGDPARKGTGLFSTRQARAKAYPGLRHLEVLKGVGEAAIVASICPETQDKAQPHFGYRPAVDTIIDRLKGALKGRCLPRRLDVQGTRTPCLVIEARYPSDGVQPPSEAELAACKTCDAPGYAVVRPEIMAILQGQDVTKYDCLCEFRQLEGADLQACQTDSRNPRLIPDINGWCYVDPAFAADADTRAKQNEIVKNCADDAKRTLRFLGTRGATGGTDERTELFITCLGAASGGDASGAEAPGALQAREGQR